MRTPSVPPAIPVTFLAAAPFSVAAAGVLLAVEGIDALRTGYAASTLLLTHLGTLGFLGAALFGAVYALAPAVAGAPVPGVRSAYVVLGSLLVGLSAVGLILCGGVVLPLHAGFGFVELAALIFVGTVGWTLFRRARTSNETLGGLRTAVATLLVVVLLGTVMERALAGDARPGARSLWLQVHLSLAFLGWVGPLVASMSWSERPAFGVSPATPRPARRAMLGGIVAGVVLLVAVLALDAGRLLPATAPAAGRLATLAAAPAALAVWVAHPWITLRRFVPRDGLRRHATDRLWSTGLATAPLVLATAAWAAFTDVPRAAVLFGWLAVWGWAGTIAHATLGRLLLRLVRPRPPLDAQLRRGLVLHGASLITGAAAIITQSDPLARLAGALVAATAAAMMQGIARAWRRE